MCCTNIINLLKILFFCKTGRDSRLQLYLIYHTILCCMFTRLFSRKKGLLNIKIFKFVSIIIVLIVLCYFINIEIKSKKEPAGLYLTSESKDINQAISFVNYL